MEIMQILTFILVFIFGSVIGSFLNVLILRLPEDKSLKGRSVCPNCQNQLGFWQLWPIVSFIFLAGKCAHCGKKISWRYPAIEIICALAFLFAWLQIRPEGLAEYLFLAEVWFFVAFAIAVFVIDLEHYLIFDSLVFPALGFFLLVNLGLDLLGQGGGFKHSLGGIYGMMAGALPFYLIWRFSKGRLMGLGDAKLMLPLGAAAGWPGVLVLLFIAVFLGSLVGIGLLVSGKKTLKSPLPFGCFLVIGGFFALLYGEKIIRWYLSLLGG